MGNGLEEAAVLTHQSGITLRYTGTVTVHALRR
jgi:hypothetical protein